MTRAIEQEKSGQLLEEVARRQKWMVVSFLFSALFVAATMAWMLTEAPAASVVSYILYVISFVFAVVFYIAMGLLAQHLHGTGMAVVTVLASVLVPLVALVAVVVLSYQATRELKNHDVRTGLLGADMSQFGHQT